MKHVTKIFSAAIISTAFMSSAAGAASCDGVITLTGPGSNNTINCSEVNNIALSCVNDIIVGTINTQTGTSGEGNVSDNNSGGTVASGTVVNNNGQNVTVGASCNTAAIVETPSFTPAPTENPGGGLGEANAPEELPNTAGDSPIASILASVLLASTGAIGVSRIVTVVHRRTSK